jgi:hypothetical protein
MRPEAHPTHDKMTALYELTRSVLDGTARGDPSYDRGLFDGLQAMFSLCLDYFELKGFLDKEDLLNHLRCDYDEINNASRIWDLVVDEVDGETLSDWEIRMREEDEED